MCFEPKKDLLKYPSVWSALYQENEGIDCDGYSALLENRQLEAATEMEDDDMS